MYDPFFRVLIFIYMVIGWFIKQLISSANFKRNHPKKYKPFLSHLLEAKEKNGASLLIMFVVASAAPATLLEYMTEAISTWLMAPDTNLGLLAAVVWGTATDYFLGVFFARLNRRNGNGGV